MLFFVAVLFTPAFHAETSETEAQHLLEASIANGKANAREALKFAFHEHSENTSARGAAADSIVFTTADFEVLFLDGIPYRRLTMKDGKPLSPELEQAESERYDKARNAIRSMTPEQREAYMQKKAGLQIDPSRVLSLSVCAVQGKDKVAGRSATRIACHPRTDIANPTPEQQAILRQDILFWVDDESPFLSRTKVTLLQPDTEYGPGTVIIVDWTKMDNVWHHTRTFIDWRAAKPFDAEAAAAAAKSDPASSGRGRGGRGGPSNGTVSTHATVYMHGTNTDTFTKFKKFQVQARIVN
jgi:hypothetical protein